MVFLSDSELSQAAINKLVIAVQHTVETILKQNDQTIWDVVYSTYDPSTYERTGEFREAWDTRTGTATKYAEGEFYFRPETMSVDFGADPPQHADINGNPVTQYMADILYEGAMGCIYRPTNRNAWKVLDKWLSNTKFRQIFEDGLNQSGLEWKRSTGAVTKTTE